MSNAAAAAITLSTPFAISYVGYPEVFRQNTIASIINNAGHAAAPSTDSVSFALQSEDIKSALASPLIMPGNANLSYPIVGLTYAALYNVSSGDCVTKKRLGNTLFIVNF